MKVTLANGKELEALGVRGEPVFFMGQSRDCLTFLFDPAKYGLEQLDKLFSAENCGHITLTDEENGGAGCVHTGYILRKNLEKGPETDGPVAAAAGSAPPGRIMVRMAQISYLEQAQADLTDAVDTLILSGLEG